MVEILRRERGRQGAADTAKSSIIRSSRTGSRLLKDVISKSYQLLVAFPKLARILLIA